MNDRPESRPDYGPPEGVGVAEPGVPGDPDAGAGLRRSAVRGGAAVVGSRLAVQVLTVGVTFLVARILTPYDYALITCMSVFVNLADTLAAAGLVPALVQKPSLEEADLREGFAMSLGLSLAFFGALYAAAPPLSAYFAYPEMTVVIRVCALTLLLLPFRTIPAALLERRMQLGRHAAVFSATALLQSAVTLGGALMGLGYWCLVVSFCVSRVFDTAVFAWLAGWRPRARLPGASSRGLARFGLQVTGTALLWQFYAQADYAVAAKVAGPVALGYYALAFQIVSLPTNRLVGSFGQAAYTVFCRLQDRPDQVREWYLRLVGLTGAVALPVFVGMALVAGDGVAAVLGAKWGPAVSPIRLLCPAGYALLMMGTLQPVLNALGRADLPAKYNAVYALIMPAAFFLLGRRFGLTGICAAWAVGYPLVSAALVTVSRPVLGFGVRELARTQYPAWVSAALMAAAVLGVQHALPGAGRGPVRLAAAVAAGVVVYPAAIWATARRTVVRDLGAMVRAFRG